MSALDDVLDALARAVDDEAPGESQLGEIRLRPHQLEAVRDLRASIAEFGGALLADEPGFGKTYTALAVARDYPACLVAAPAALRDMWRDACARACVTAEFVSLEVLSRGRVAPRAPLLVIDEAHRVSNPGTARYRAVALCAQGAHVLLLTATPVRNRKAELDALLRLFLGGSSAKLAADARARCVIRRTAIRQAGLPAVVAHTGIRPRDGRPIATLLQALAEPLLIAHGGSAATLVRGGLARYWASSEAALEQALVRRLQRGFAMRDLFDAGQLPSREELRAWVLGDDATQLPLPFSTPGVSGDAGDVARWKHQLDVHLASVLALREAVHDTVTRDTAWRVMRLREICGRHDGQVVVAFATLEATARALFGHLSHVPGVALLTSRGARTAGGPVPRSEIIGVLGPPTDSIRRNRRFDVRMVIATDLLSEGVNLQGASVIVHLDQPWTPAAVAQRVGRAARIGSAHQTVHEYRFMPPRAAQAMLEMPKYHARKRQAAHDALAATTARERLRSLCSAWLLESPQTAPAVCAAAQATTAGMIVRVQSPARAWLAGSRASGVHGSRITDDPALIARLAAAVTRTEAAPPSRFEVDRIARDVARWLDRRRAAATASGITATVYQRRLLSRLDALLDGCTPSRRPMLAARIGRLRALLVSTHGAATELHARTLLGRPSDAAGWLDEAERRFGGDANGRVHRQERAEISAILVLRPARRAPPATAPVAPAPAPSPAPPATSTGIAALP